MAENEGRTAVYRLYDKYGSVLYVGISEDPERRFREHAADKDWWKFVAGRDIDWYGRRIDAEMAEEAAIKLHVPPFNKEHSPEWPHVPVTVELPPSLIRALDRLCRTLPPGARSRTEALVFLLDREIGARGLAGSRPCLHSGMGWPDGLTVAVAEDGLCSCGTPIRPDGRFPEGTADCGDFGEPPRLVDLPLPPRILVPEGQSAS